MKSVAQFARVTIRTNRMLGVSAKQSIVMQSNQEKRSRKEKEETRRVEIQAKQCIRRE